MFGPSKPAAPLKMRPVIETRVFDFEKDGFKSCLMLNCSATFPLYNDGGAWERHIIEHQARGEPVPEGTSVGV